jgi:hypothetical protein
MLAAMGEIRIETLRDHAQLYRLHAYCPYCRHSAWLNPMRVARLVGWDAPVRLFGKALRCSRCGARGCCVTISHNGCPA